MTNEHELPEPLRHGTYDVIVVGARVAGASTAMLLARGGLRVALLERGHLGADTLSTHALMRGGVLQLTRWGLLDEIVQAGTPPVRRTTFRYGDEEIVISIKASHGVDALYAPRRTLLDPMLVRAAVEAGVEVHHGTRVLDVLVAGGRVAGVRASAHGGASFDLRAPLVIGADGIRSTIATQVGASYVRLGGPGSSVTYGYWSELETDGYEWGFEPNACWGMIPTNDGQTCVFAGGAAGRTSPGRHDGIREIRDLMAKASPGAADRLRHARPPKATRTWGGHRGYLRQAHGPGWALVGDAGYFKDPLSAHGLTDALRDAELLSRAVLRSWTAGSGGPQSLDEHLRGYEEERDRLSLQLFDVVDQIAGQQWTTDEIGGLLRRLSSSMADEVDALVAMDPAVAR